MEWSLTGVPLPIVLRPPSPLTDDELLAFSRKNRPYRVEKNTEGDLIIMTPVGGEGGYWEASISARLTVWAEKDARGLAFSPNTGFNLPDGSTLSPDASWVSLQRWNALTTEEQRRYPPLCPEFVIELRSTSDSLRPLQQKMVQYLENGAQLGWLIDPAVGTVTIFRPGREPEVLHQPAQVIGEGPVAGFTLATARLWTR